MKEHVFEARDLLVAQRPGTAELDARGRAMTRAGGRSRAAARDEAERPGPARRRAGDRARACCSPGRSRAGCSATWAPRSSRSSRPGQPDPIREWGKARYEGRSLWWPVQSRNKKCVTLNLRTERGQELLLELVSSSDVVTENFRPGTLERWNLGFERL